MVKNIIGFYIFTQLDSYLIKNAATATMVNPPMAIPIKIAQKIIE